jgi:hypothetical protein
VDEHPWLAEELKDAHAESAKHHAAFAAALALALAAARANRRGRSISEVANEIEARLISDGFVYPREMVMWHARDIVEPYWTLRHPIEVIRGIRASRRGRDENPFEDSEFFGDPDPFGDEATDDPEREALLDLLRTDPSLRGVSFSSLAPNVIGVCLEPWSEASAQWVRDVCSPREVRFIDDMPQWADGEDRWA